jgi:hypothetical protein
VANRRPLHRLGDCLGITLRSTWRELEIGTVEMM